MPDEDFIRQKSTRSSFLLWPSLSSFSWYSSAFFFFDYLRIQHYFYRFETDTVIIFLGLTLQTLQHQLLLHYRMFFTHPFIHSIENFETPHVLIKLFVVLVDTTRHLHNFFLSSGLLLESPNLNTTSYHVTSIIIIHGFRQLVGFGHYLYRFCFGDICRKMRRRVCELRNNS